MIAGAPLDPVPVVMLPVLDFGAGPHRFRVRDGFHRVYASVAAGFTELPIDIVG